MKTRKIVSASVQLLLGLLAAYGGVLHFTADVAIWNNAFLRSLYQTGYLWQFIGVINLVAGVLLIINRYTLVALLALLPITVNIFLYHLFFFTTEGLFIGIPMLLLNLWCIWLYRSNYKQLVQLKVAR
jgi:putative oxidoreductase